MPPHVSPSTPERPVVCVQGLGFVGAAMAVAVAAARDQRGQPRFSVVGVDLPTAPGQERIDCLNSGRFPFRTSDGDLVDATARAHAAGNLRASSDRAASLRRTSSSWMWGTLIPARATRNRYAQNAFPPH